MRIKIPILLVIVFFLSISCSDDDKLISNDISSKILVEGYIFANEPIKIKVSLLDVYGSSVSKPLGYAEVIITQNGSEFLIPQNDTLPGTYQRPMPALTLNDTGLIKLEIRHDEKIYIAQTRFPSKISNLQISDSIIEINPGNTNNIVATLNFNGVADAYGYCLFIRNTNGYAMPVGNNGGYESSESPFAHVNSNTVIALKSADFKYTGTYDIYVTAVGSEYAMMYSGFGTNNLISAPSNIQNGWGVFTAFNGEAVTVTVQ